VARTQADTIDAPAAPKETAKILILRSCAADGSSHGGKFKYPLTEGAVVEAPDWNPKPACGGGLHGLPWGQGDNSLMNWSEDAWWQVFECDAADVVRIDAAKCKFRRGVQVFLKQGLAPGFALAQAYLIANDTRPAVVAGGTHSDEPSGRASASGYSGSASASGDSGSASASGSYGRASASGDSGSTSASGDSGSASASGSYGRASASGYSGSASASGKQSIAACIGYQGRAMAGEDGCLIVAWHDGNRPRVCVGYVGEDGIEAGKWYAVVNGKLVASL